MNFSWDVGVWKNSYFSQSIDWLWEGEDLQQQAPLETLGTSLPCLWMQLLWIGLCIFSVKEICPFFFFLKPVQTCSTWCLSDMLQSLYSYKELECLRCFSVAPTRNPDWHSHQCSETSETTNNPSGHSPKSYKIVSIVHFSFSLLKKRWELGIFSWFAHMVVERGGSYGR